MAERPERIPERYPLVQDPPFLLDAVRTFLFGVPCEPARLDAMLARTFDWAAPDVRVRRLGATCLLVFTDVARASASDPMLGSFAYQEVAWFVPILVERAGTTSLAMHVPFIYPSEGLATAAGREVYGLPKKPGLLAVPPSAAFWSGTAPLSLGALAAERFDGTAWTRRPVCVVESQPQAPVNKLESELHRALDALLGGLPAGLSRLLHQDLVQHKQVADVTTGGLPARVLYRALTRVRAPVDSIADVRFADPSRVTVRTESLASEPIVDVLGLPRALTPTFAAELTMRFRFAPGEVLKEVPEQPPVPVRKTRVLVLGGGMSALATAHALTDTAERRAQHEVRVLVQGHLLGGKGASSRNRTMGNRNEEHGLHVFFGFYHNALRMMRSVYDEANRSQPTFPATFDQAFLPKSSIVFHDGTHGFRVTFPPRPSGWGASVGIAAELRALRDVVESALGGPLETLVVSSLTGTLDPIARDIVLFTLTLIRGVTADLVLGGKSWDDLDAEDFRDWMARHHIPFAPDLSRSAIMQVPYDGVFAYEGPDQSRPRLGAGIAARGLIKLVSAYEVAPYLAMAAGMGEVVFAPLFEVLAARGVRFEFFSTVKELHVDAGRAVSVRYARQATVSAGAFGYTPTTRLPTAAGTIPTFPSAPDLAQLSAPVPIAGLDPYSDAVTAEVPGDLTLAVDADFDWVVCGLPAPVSARI